MFDGGPQFVFNLGGGPGFRVHQFGGTQPRRRPRESSGPSDQPPPSMVSAISNLLPLLILFLLPFLTSIFSSSSFSSSAFSSSSPSFRFDSPSPPHTLHRTSSRFKVDYYVDPNDIVDWSARQLDQLDQRIESNYLGRLKAECEIESDQKERMLQDAQGWFFQDLDQIRQANRLEMKACRTLERLRSGRL